MNASTGTPVREIAPQLGKLLGMLGSRHDGEVLNAPKKAHETMISAGLTCGEVFEPLIALPAPVNDDDQSRVLVDALLDGPSLSNWEFRFIVSIDRWLSLESIHDKQVGEKP